jgi:hypothetical protein
VKVIALTILPFSWSYLCNFTIVGHAVYMSMDIPDAFLAVRLHIHRISFFYTNMMLRLPNF